MFQVQSGVPQTTNRGGRGRKPTAFPFGKMEVGDSFLIPCDTQDKRAVDSWRRKLLVAKKRFNEQYEGDPWVFSTSLRNSPDERGIRVWRTA